MKRKVNITFSLLPVLLLICCNQGTILQAEAVEVSTETIMYGESFPETQETEAEESSEESLETEDETVENLFESSELEDSETKLTTNISAGTFQYTTIGDYVLDGTTLVSYTGSDIDVDIPIELGITEIGELAFSECDNMEVLTIPNGVTSIGNFAFSKCESLVSVCLSESVISIGDWAFSACGSLTSINIPNSMTSIGEGAFYYCTMLSKISIPNSVTSIGDWAFTYCRSLTSINIPSGVTSIGEGTYWQCINLTSISIPKNITSIGRSAFGLCTSLTSMIIPDGISSIEPYTFFNCANLTYVIIPDTVTSIGINAFKDCPYILTIRGDEGSFAEAYAAENGIHFEAINMRLKKEFVTRLYNIVLGRAVDEQGMNTWTEGLIFGNHTGASVIQSIFNSTEYKNKKTSDTVFVENAYQAILGRGSDVAGKTTWTGYLTDGVSRNYVLNGFVQSSEFTKLCSQYGIQKGSIPLTEYRDKNINITRFVQRLYSTCLGRAADVSGLNTWTKGLITGTHTGASVVWSFYNSNEYKSKNKTNSEYIDTLYKALLNRGADSSGKNSWLAKMTVGMSRTYIFKGFAESGEFTNLCKSYGITRGNVTVSENRDKNYGITSFVSRLYTKALVRSIDVDGLNNWTGQLINKKKTAQQVAEAFINSTEFTNKKYSNEAYVKILYRTFLNREYDSAGLKSWVSKLNSGTSRNTVLKGFAGSQEFKKIAASYGL